VTFGGDDAHKIVDVLRLRAGETVVVVDSAAQEFVASLRIRDGEVSAQLDALGASGVRESSIDLTLAQAIPKGQKLDFVVEKATELGLSRLIPVRSSRTVGDASQKKVERWRRLARAAAQQCGRTRVPKVDEPIDFSALLEQMRGFDATIFAWELATAPLRTALQSLKGARRVLVVVGPEGGFSHDEATAAIAAGAHAVSLGARILRTETAPLVLLSVLLYESGDLQ
jgi:16S rRNA (uracil1498-N3)-methyltransferase